GRFGDTECPGTSGSVMTPVIAGPVTVGPVTMGLTNVDSKLRRSKRIVFEGSNQVAPGAPYSSRFLPRAGALKACFRAYFCCRNWLQTLEIRRAASTISSRV